jgi:signal transduction histidine kinase
MRRLVTVSEDERRRVSRDLHDTAGQTLTALLLAVKAARAEPTASPPVAARLDTVLHLAEELARQLHDLAVRLRPTALDDLGLCPALAQLVSNWSAHSGVPATFDATGVGEARFRPEVETALYRVVQEALTNVAKHARATHVAVLVGRRDGHAVAVIEDNGRGFDPAPAITTPPDGTRRPIGLLGMRERAAVLGGTLEIESSPGAGTTVFARIPLGGAGGR